MKLIPLIWNIVLVFLFSSLLFSCTKYYHQRPNQIKKQQELQASKGQEGSSSENQLSKRQEWSILVNKNHVVIHHGNEMLDLFSVRYDENTDSVKCFFRPFEGKPFDYYNQVLASRRSGAKIGEESTTRDVQQVHLFVNSLDKLSGSEIAFSIKDIFEVDVTEKAVYLNVLISNELIPNNQVWRILESQNHVVIHHDDKMLEIYSIRYNENTDSLKCFSRPFEDRPLYYYNKLGISKKGRALRSKGSSTHEIQQVHLFIDNFDKLSGSEITFSIKDISQVDVLKSAVGSNVIASVGIVVSSFVVVFGGALAIVAVFIGFS
jgi:hypothetical protein